jgi:CheY-like chemotaxis protein
MPAVGRSPFSASAFVHAKVAYNSQAKSAQKGFRDSYCNTSIKTYTAPMPVGLVCEDDQGIRLLIEVVLRRQGVDAVSARNGQEAAERLKERDFDVLVVDLMMPRYSGYDFIEGIRTARPELLKKVIVVTAAAAVVRDHAPKDVAAVILKPFDVEKLGAEIMKVVVSS